MDWEGRLDSELAMTTFLHYIATSRRVARVPYDRQSKCRSSGGPQVRPGKSVVNSISMRKASRTSPKADLVRRTARRRRHGVDERTGER